VEVRAWPVLVTGVLLLGACVRGDASPSATPAPLPSTSLTAPPSPLVDEGEIVSGGVPKDAIPAIDDPVFAPAGEVSTLEDREPVLSVEHEGEAKAYPLRILIWHEIVNDTIGGDPVAVTYCPLCNSALTFLRRVDGRTLDFGTSGKLYRSNLVMYDRQTDSYWTQLSGQAVTGELAGTVLERIPSSILSWGEWSATHPDGSVLTTDTGHERDYGQNPYVGYDTADRPFLYQGEPDGRLPAGTHVLGLAIASDVVAVPYPVLEERAVAGAAASTTDVGGEPVAVFWSAGTASALDSPSIPDGRRVGAAAAFDARVDGRILRFEATPDGVIDRRTGSVWSIAGVAVEGPLRGTRLAPLAGIDSLWFSWAAFYPQTRIWPGT
jgi:hypothetical protein